MKTGQTHGEIWSGGAQDWARFMEVHYRHLYELVHDRLVIGEGTRLLDVGCGAGSATVLAARRGARVAGIDASPGSIDMAREQISEGDFRVGDMEELPWPDGSFDAVTGFNSFPFAGNPVAALTEAHRVLTRGGKLGAVIFSPREQSQQPKIMAAIGALAPPQPPNAPGPFALSGAGVMESTLQTAGLRLLDCGDATVALDYPDGEAACRAMMAGGGAGRAIQHSGQERVRQAIRVALEEFRLETGRYRIENHFRFFIAE